MKFTNFTPDETETLIISAELFLSMYFDGKGFKGSDEDTFKVVDVLISRTHTEEELANLEANEDLKVIKILNLYRNELCYMMFRSLYLMYYGTDINNLPSPIHSGVSYGDTILKGVNIYAKGKHKKKMKRDRSGKLVWKKSKGCK